MDRAQDYMAVLLSLPEAVLSCDCQGTVTLANPAAERLTDRSASELVGTHCSELFLDGSELQSIADGLRDCGAAPKAEVLRLTLAPPADASRHVDVRVTPLLQGDVLQGMVLTMSEPPLWADPELHRDLVEHAGTMIVMADGSGRVSVANRAAREFLGLGPEASLLGRSVAGTIVPRTPEAAAALESSLRDLVAAPKRYAITEHEYPQADGTSRWVAWRNCAIGGPDGKLKAVLCVGTDITQRVTTERALRDSEQRFREMAEVTPAVFWTMSPDGSTVQFCSPGFETIFGRSVAEIRDGTVSWHSMLHPEDRERMEAAASSAGALDGPVEYRILRPDGDVRWLRDHVVPVFDDAGRVDHLVGLGVDITDLKRAEESLRTSLERRRSLQDAVPGGIIVLGKDGRTLEANEMAQELMGVSLEEMRGDGPVDPRWHAIHPDGSPFPVHTRPALITLRTGQSFRNVVTGIYHPSAGTYRWILVNSEPIFDHSHGTVEAAVAILTDITDRKRAEEALLESERTAWALLNATHDAAVLLDTDFDVIAANEACATALCTSVPDLVGTNVLSQVDPERARSRREHLRRVLQTGRPARFDEAGEGQYLTLSAYPVLDERGKVVRIALFAHDITDRKRAEDAQRLAAIGHLSAGVAHEFNNVLAGMKAAADLAGYLRTQEEYQQLIETVRAGAAHGAEICRNLTAFARPHEPRRAPFRLEQAVDAALALAAPHIARAAVEVRRAYAPEPFAIFGDAGQVEQVVLNLVINAAHAMPDGGTLSLATNYTTGDRGEPVAVLNVSDMGSGISPEHLPHVFEPFFTTKGRLGESDTPGTGLGLSVSMGIVRAHGGTIDVRTQPGAGTTFSVRLPAHGVPRAAGAAGADVPRSEGAGGFRVLVAADESELSRTLTRLLERNGLQVHRASSVRQVQSALRARSFGLLIADLSLPGGGGLQLIACAQDVASALPVVLVLGHSDAPPEYELPTERCVVCLRTPFSVSEFVDAIHAALRRPSSGRTTPPGD